MVKPTEVRWLVQLQQRHFIGENVKPMHLSQNRVTIAAAVVPGRMVAAHRKTFESTASGEWRIYVKQKIRTTASLQVGRIGSKLTPILHRKTPMMLWVVRVPRLLLGPVTAYLHFRPNPMLDRWKNH